MGEVRGTTKYLKLSLHIYQLRAVQVVDLCHGKGTHLVEVGLTSHYSNPGLAINRSLCHNPSSPQASPVEVVLQDGN